jgi:hypothetical protein
MSEGVVTPRVPWYQSESQTNTVITSIWSNRVSGQVKQVKKHSNHECLVKQNKHSNQGGDPTQGEVFSNQNSQLNEGNSSTQLPKGKPENTWGGTLPSERSFQIRAHPREIGTHMWGTLPKARLFQLENRTNNCRREIQSKNTWGDRTQCDTWLEIFQERVFF